MPKRPASQKFFSFKHDLAQIEFNKSIAGCYRDGNAEYDSVGVLLLTWREDDLNCKEKEVDALEKVFKEKFNFRTEQYQIPSTGSEQALFNRLQAFSRCYDNPSKLGIVYYGGHAERRETEKGIDLELFARIGKSPHVVGNGSIQRTYTSLSDVGSLESPTDTTGTNDIPISNERTEQPHISFKAICEQIQDSETDMLLIVDSCHAAVAFNDQTFGGRKCELFCSIAEKDWARAPDLEGSFTKILTTTLVKMIEKTPEGFSTSELYRQVYRQQHAMRKPLHFTQSRLDFGKIWLRPCWQQDKPTVAPKDSKHTIDVRFHLTKSVDMTELNKVVKALQWIPYVQMINMRNMHSPNDDLSVFIRTVYLANRLRPVLTRVRRKLELKRAQQLCRTDSSCSSSSATTSEQFHVHEPRDVGLFDWSKIWAVTSNDERLTSDQYFHSKAPSHRKLSDSRVPATTPGYPSMVDAAPQGFIRETPADALVQYGGIRKHRAAQRRLSQRTLDGLLFFSMGVLAPTVLRWAVQGSASSFAAL